MSTVYENPSAGKFEPPPPPPTPAERRVRTWRVVATVLTFVVILEKWLYPSRSWMAFAFATLAAVACILDWAATKTQMDEVGPYRKDQHLTR